MKNNKKEIYIGLAVLVSVIFVVSLISVFKKKKVEAPIANNELDNLLTASVVPLPSKKVYRKRKTMNVLSEMDKLNNISYTEAIMKYNDGHLIQFAENCQSNPYRMVIANGSELMLDNRSSNKEIISIGNTKYNLSPYGFRIIKLNELNVPATNLIDCTISKNVNTLIVE